MSDISEANAQRMMLESKRMHAAVEKLTGMIQQQNLKIMTLTNEMASLKKAQIMATVNAQIAARGNGGTG